MLDVDDIAAICHEVNRAVCQAVGDQSQIPWVDAPKWQKMSAVDGVINVLLHESTPEQSHANWTAFKLADGWTRGDVKDPVKKTHPCLVPFVDLPVEQKIKDYVFTALVQALAGYAVFKKDNVTVAQTEEGTPVLHATSSDQKILGSGLVVPELVVFNALDAEGDVTTGGPGSESTPATVNSDPQAESQP